MLPHDRCSYCTDINIRGVNIGHNMVPVKLGLEQLGPGQSGPGQFGPKAQLSGVQMSAPKKWTIAPKTVLS